MSQRSCCTAVIALFLALVPFASRATELRNLSDRQLVDRAEAVVVATVTGTAPAQDGRYAFTDVTLRVAEVLKGDVAAGQALTVRTAGGSNGRYGMFVVGAAHYTAGSRVLAFLDRDGSRWRTESMSLGAFTFRTGLHGREILVRDTDGERTEPARDARAFTAFVREAAHGRAASADYYAADATPRTDLATRTDATPASAYLLVPPGGTYPVRWPGQPGYSVQPFSQTGSIAGLDTAGAASGGASAWSTVQGAFVTLSASGTSPGSDPSTFPSTGVQHNTIYLGYTGSTSQYFCDATACTVLWYSLSTTHTFNGETFSDLAETDIIFPSTNTWSQQQFDTVMAHEFGHTIGIRHADAGNPSSSTALMTSITNVAYGQNPQLWDRQAVQTAYGNGAPCVPAAINSVSGGGNVPTGSSDTLTVSASGDAPLTYQWYSGASGTTTTPVGTNSASFTTPPVTQTVSYWVRVSNSCGQADSQTFTLTPVCNAPSITVQPQSTTWVSAGVTLTVGYSPSAAQPVTVQWYVGAPGDTSVPVGNNTTSLSVTGLTQTTAYWVRLSNQCGSIDSAGATITVPGTCQGPAITTQPQSATIPLGSAPSLTVVASGPSLTYQWYSGTSGDVSKPIAGATSSSYTGSPIAAGGSYSYWVRITNSCKSVDSAAATITVSCDNAPAVFVVVPGGAILSTQSYTVKATASPSVYTSFEVQEATSADFAGAVTYPSQSGNVTIPPHGALTGDAVLYYRARGTYNCSGSTRTTDWSSRPTAVVIVVEKPGNGPFNIPTPPCTGGACNVSVGLSTGAVNVSGKDAASTAISFSITADKPWMSVTPSSGTMPPEGKIVTLNLDTTNLPSGSNQGTVTIIRTLSTGKDASSTSTSTVQVPVSVSIVAPVAPKSGAPTSNTLVIPAVAHAEGVGSPFYSDVRITNTASQAINYVLTFTPRATDGTQTGKQLPITIAANSSFALDDIVKTWFGSGVGAENGIGSIEVRPMNWTDKPGAPLATVASSRTYASTATGTFGQFIPALPLSQFLGKSASSFVSLQQVANSTAYRTNFGLVEGSGKTATVDLRLVDPTGKTIATAQRTLLPYQLDQFAFSQVFPSISSLVDGRLEVRVASDTGRVSAYASVLDNRTNDPLLVFPVDPSKVQSSRYVLPGIGDFDIGAAHWKSDLRLFNGGAADAPVTLTYYASDGTTKSLNVTIHPNEVKAFDNFIASNFGLSTTAGSVLVSGPGAAKLVATARTYTDTGSGTYGQFIPGVTPAEGVGVGDRALQVQQLEQSPSFRSNVGIAELTGNPVTVRVRGWVPDSKTTAIIEVPIPANGFKQLNAVLAAMGYPNVYNGRVSVEVISGSGKVTAYGSNIDNRTQDPTYVPAQ